MASPPNVLFVIADDHRFDAIRAHGDPTVLTPTLDRLVASGVTLRRTYHGGALCGAVCVPSRASLHTGRNVFAATVGTGVDDYARLLALRPELRLFAETFRQAGYHTFATGKWHNDKRSFNRSFCGGESIFFGGMSDHRAVPVFDYDPAAAYPKTAARIGDGFSTELFSESAIRFLERYDRPKPFLLYLAYTSPHDPRTAPQEFAGLYDPARVPLPRNFMPRHPFDNGEMAIRDEQLAPWPRTPEAVRGHIADYYAMISHHDAWIGRVLETLRRTGRATNTIVVYTADHGLAVGQHGLLGKQNLYEHSVRVPAILAGPGVPSGRSTDALTCLYDLYPTLCELCGIAVPATVESRGLARLLRGEDSRGRETVCSLYNHIQRMVTDGRWKLIRYYRDPMKPGGENRLQLFDLAADPWETNDLSPEPAHRETLVRLAAALTDWMRSVGDPLAAVAVEVHPA